MLRFENIFGSLLAFYFLVGRWTPSRLVDESAETPLIAQPRVWAVIALAGLACLRLARHAGGRVPSKTAAIGLRNGAMRIALCGLLLLLYMASTAMWAPWQAAGSDKLAEVGLLIVVQLSLLAVFVNCDALAARNAFWESLVVTTCVMALLGVLAHDSGRASALGGGPNVFGRNMGLMMIGGVYLLGHRWREKRFRIVRVGLLVVLGGLLVILSGSRGAMASVAGAVVLLMLLRRTLNLRRMLPWVVVPALTGCGLMFTDIGRESVEAFRYRIVELTLADRYTSDRDVLFMEAIQTGVDYPVLGIGLDGFRHVRWDEYPHNFFLEVFAEGGGVGLLLAGGMMLAVFAQLRTNSLTWEHSTLAAFFLVLASAQFSGDLYDSRGVFLFAVLIAIPTAAHNLLTGECAGATGVSPVRVRLSAPSAALAKPLGHIT